MDIMVLKYTLMGLAGFTGVFGLGRHLCQVWITKIQCDKEQTLLKMAQDHEVRMFGLHNHPQGKKAPPDDHEEDAGAYVRNGSGVCPESRQGEWQNAACEPSASGAPGGSPGREPGGGHRQPPAL